MMTNKSFQKVAKNFECECGNTYKHRQGLYKHKKNMLHTSRY